MQKQVDLTGAEPIGFNVKNEPWVKYRLEDKTKLLARLIVGKIYKTAQYDALGQPIYGWASQNILTIMAPKELRGPPTDPPPVSSDLKDYNATSIDFERIGAEQWNVYELEDQSLLRLKLEITSVNRTDKFTLDGEPFYIILSSVVTRIKVAPSLIKKMPTKIAPSQPRSLYG